MIMKKKINSKNLFWIALVFLIAAVGFKLFRTYTEPENQFRAEDHAGVSD